MKSQYNCHVTETGGTRENVRTKKVTIIRRLLLQCLERKEEFRTIGHCLEFFSKEGSLYSLCNEYLSILLATKLPKVVYKTQRSYVFYAVSSSFLSM